MEAGDPPPVAPAEAAGLLGQLASVRMTCGVRPRGKALHRPRSAGGGLEVLVPERRLADFPGLDG